MGESFWVASPFFTGRFVQFNISGPPAEDTVEGAPGVAGTMQFSSTIPSCDF